MTRAQDCPIPRNLPESGPPWLRWFSGFLYLVSFTAIAGFSLLWALGYRVNAATNSIQQTGVLELSSPQAGLMPTISVNGEKQSDSFPFLKRWLFPGRYDVLITADGYQDWERQIVITPNARVSVSSIVLLYKTPKTISAPAVRLDELTNRTRNQSGLVIRRGNELWVRDSFVTRTSDDIVQVEWYLDDRHVLYQVGTTVRVLDLETKINQDVLVGTTNAPIPYVLKENGRVIVYALGDAVSAIELYQPVSLIDRLR